MSKKKSLIITASILFILALACIIIAVVIGIRQGSEPDVQDLLDMTTAEYTEADPDPETAFLTEPEWIRGANCAEQFTFGRDGHYAYWCACGEPVGDSDLYDTYEYKDGVITLTGTDRTSHMNVIYYDEHFLCLYLEEEKECRVFVDSEYANADYAEHEPYSFTSDNWFEIHVLGYDGENLKVAPYGYDGDAKAEFAEYIKEIPVTSDVEFYSVTSVDDKGELTTEHIKLTEEDVEHIGEYYTGGYAQLDVDGNIKYVVFYGKTIIY